jgi:hypothetical protein
VQTLPQIVRERLQATRPTGDHPEANILTAFAEDSLQRPERTRVLEHLSHCADCRDVLALALPELNVVAPLMVLARRSWFTWPALRWGFATAGILTACTFGVLQYRRHLQPEAIVAKQISSPEAADRIEAPAPAPPSAAAGAERSAASQTRSAQPRLATGIAKSSRPENEIASVHGPVPLRQVPQAGAGVAGATLGAPAANHFGRPVPRPPQPSLYESPALVAVPKQSAGNVASAQAKAAFTPPAAQLDMSSEAAAARLETQSSNAPQALAENDSLHIGKAKPADAPIWTVGVNGVLERSFDQGSTWQDVDVTAASAQVTDNLLRPGTASGTAAKKYNHVLAMKRPELPPVFRAVSANGPDVWAGGVGGVLYHSVDAGNRWTRVAPIFGDTTLMGDVVSVEFSDTMHGRIMTSTEQVWTTSDDGQTWQEQQQ